MVKRLCLFGAFFLGIMGSMGIMGNLGKAPEYPEYPESPVYSPFTFHFSLFTFKKGIPSWRCPYLFIISCRISGSDDGAARG